MHESPRGAAPPLVLVVDDEPLMRALMQATLAPVYRVVVASDGQEALALFRELGHEVSAVVTDLQMPRLDGMGLAVALRRSATPPPILFVSGYSGRGGELPGPFIAKPFLPEKLLAALEELLAAKH